MNGILQLLEHRVGDNSTNSNPIQDIFFSAPTDQNIFKLAPQNLLDQCIVQFKNNNSDSYLYYNDSHKNPKEKNATGVLISSKDGTSQYTQFKLVYNESYSGYQIFPQVDPNSFLFTDKNDLFLYGFPKSINDHPMTSTYQGEYFQFVDVKPLQNKLLCKITSQMLSDDNARYYLTLNNDNTPQMYIANNDAPYFNMLLVQRGQAYLNFVINNTDYGKYLCCSLPESSDLLGIDSVSFAAACQTNNYLSSSDLCSNVMVNICSSGKIIPEAFDNAKCQAWCGTNENTKKICKNKLTEWCKKNPTSKSCMCQPTSQEFIDFTKKYQSMCTPGTSCLASKWTPECYFPKCLQSDIYKNVYDSSTCPSQITNYQKCVNDISLKDSNVQTIITKCQPQFQALVNQGGSSSSSAYLDEEEEEDSADNSGPTTNGSNPTSGNGNPTVTGGNGSGAEPTTNSGGNVVDKKGNKEDDNSGGSSDVSENSNKNVTILIVLLSIGAVILLVLIIVAFYVLKHR